MALIVISADLFTITDITRPVSGCIEDGC